MPKSSTIVYINYHIMPNSSTDHYVHHAVVAGISHDIAFEMHHIIIWYAFWLLAMLFGLVA